jgi:RNA polymerase sigma factor (sigma-70 family)
MIREEELIAMCKRQDAAAYSGLYNQHAGAVYNTILRLVDHTAEAEDILQESFVAAFQGIDGFKNTGGFRAWVKRIAINKSIDWMRKRKLRFVQLEPGQAMVEEDVIDEAIFEFTIDAVNEAIAGLPDGYRTVFNLFAVEQLSHTEISQMLGLQNTTVRSQYHRAKHKILETLRQGGYHERRIRKVHKP